MSRQDIINELHKQARRHFPRCKVVIKGIDDLWQADLVDMKQLANYNSQYKYMLTIIDCFSKYAWVKPLKNKSSRSVTDAMREVLNKTSRRPKNLQTDQGTEFFNRDFRGLMNQTSINHYHTFSVMKASIIERFNRTLKEKMWKMFSMQGSYEWVNLIDLLTTEYNRSIHRTIKMAPADVTHQNENAILKKSFQPSRRNISSKKTKFQHGDHVRISKYKSIFDKGYTPNWSTEIFRIDRINRKAPITYLLRDMQDQPIHGRFYEPELQKTEHINTYLVEKVLKRKNKGNQLYVKWLGFPPSQNSWINKDNLI